MNAEEKEKFRWQAVLATYSHGKTEGMEAIRIANEMIAEIERTAPKESEKTCEIRETWYKESNVTTITCASCGTTLQQHVGKPVECEHDWSTTGGTLMSSYGACKKCGATR